MLFPFTFSIFRCGNDWIDICKRCRGSRSSLFRISKPFRCCSLYRRFPLHLRPRLGDHRDTAKPSGDWSHSLAKTISSTKKFHLDWHWDIQHYHPGKSPDGRSFRSVGKLGLSSCSIHLVCCPLYSHSNSEHLIYQFL